MALTKNINYLTPSNFKLTLDHEHYANTEFFVQSFEHPSVSVAVATNYSSPRAMLPVAGDKINFSDLSITIFVDEDMNSYHEMFDWLTRIVTENNTVDRSENIPTYLDMTLSVLTSKNNVGKTIKYKNCILTDLSGLSFEPSNTEGHISFTASFKFSEFIII